MTFWRRIFRTKQDWESNLDDELRFHLEQHTAQNIAAGMPPGEARRQAILRLGGIEALKEECRDQRRGVWLETLWNDLAGDTTSAANGVGVTISYGYDGARRPTSVTSNLVDSSHPATLWTSDASQGYYPYGAIRKATFGNGVTEANLIEPRLQPCRIDFNSSGGVPSACNDTLTSGNIQHFHYNYGNWGSTNNGNVTEWIASGAQNFDRSYGYDSLNRLQSMSAPGDTCSGLSWTIDAWGNRNAQNATGGTCDTFNQTADANNHLPASAGYHYDAAGNMTTDGRNAYFYDAENRLVQVDGTFGNCSTATVCYLYDALGHRVEKEFGSTYVSFLHDTDGNVVSEWCTSCGFTGWSRGYVYLGGQQIAEYGDATTYFVQKDHLNSTRLVTALDESLHDSMDYLPFGEQIAGGSGSSHKFTGYERDDSESGLDDANARYYSSYVGRFMSPDPYNAGADPTNPQSWNMYGYVNNNPLGLVDPTGMNPDSTCNDPNAACTCDYKGCTSASSPCADLYGYGNGLDCYAPATVSVIATNTDLDTATCDPSTDVFQCGGALLPGGGGGSPQSPGSPQQPQRNACTEKVLSAVNNQFGSAPYSVDGNPFNYPPGGTFNLNLSGNNLPAAQFNATQPGRYPVNWWTYLIGYGPTLHVVGTPGAFDPLAQQFSNSNVGGMTSVSFTAHIDSAFPYNPIGALFHLFKDLLGAGGRNQCPG